MINHTPSVFAPSYGRIPYILIHATLLAGLLLVLALCAMPYVARAATSEWCHTITSSATAIPPQYGSPINHFSTPATSLLTIACSDAGGAVVRVSASNPPTYIYQYGFHRVNGAWKRFTFTGSQMVGPWVVQYAEAFIPELVAGEGKIIAYICQQVAGAWKCGCKDRTCARPYWQVQTYGTSRAQSTAVTDVGSLGTTASVKPGVQSLSSYMALPGVPLTLSGAGFSRTNNEILFGKTASLKNIASPSGTILSFTIPTTLPPGKYEVAVRADGKLLPGSDVLWAQERGAPAPVVSGISPALIKQGGTVTLTGSGFSRTHNDIISTFGVVDGGASKDGNTLSFTYMPFDKVTEYRDMQGNKTNVEMDITMTVVTSGGTSNTVSAKLDM